jgi:hypothetical protein
VDKKENKMKKGWFPLFIVLAFLMLAVAVTGCRTEYYPPVGEAYTKVDGKIYGAVQREGLAPWSDGDGKVINLPLSNLSVVGK